MNASRKFNDEFVVNGYKDICHRTFCRNARMMGNEWHPVSNPKEARARNARACENCMPYKMLAGDTETMILHMPDCYKTRSTGFEGRYFETVREAYENGYAFRGCCTPPGAKEYIKKLQDELA